jgi:AcrR family transcriptional regulator
MVRAQAQRRLSRQAWAEAALDAIADGGLAAVAVEPLAVRLGTTKGSFYWHYRDREGLLDEALSLWEERHTEAIIAELEQLPDPAERLRRLFHGAFRHPGTGSVDAALAADADHPLVAAAVRRVTERRLRFLTETFSALGAARGRARIQALAAYTAYLGLFQLRRTAPEAVPAGAALDAYLRRLLAMLQR